MPMKLQMNPPDHYRTDGRGKRVEDILTHQKVEDAASLEMMREPGKQRTGVKQIVGGWVKDLDGETM